MKNQWMHFFYGVIKITAAGRGTERFVNDCIRQGIPVWNVRKEENGLSFFIRLKDVHALRRAARKSECKCSLQKVSGLPFLIQKSLKNSGFVIGFTLFFAVILLLSNMIWGIDVKGAKPSTEHKILKELDAMGVKTGRLQFMTLDPDSIQKKLTDNISELTWVGVELRGTHFHFEVVEKNEPEKTAEAGPQHIVAKKKAVITKMYVEKGQPSVTIHDHVEKGQLLVSGLIGGEKKKQLVAAKAEILGETWYKSEITVPSKQTFQLYSGSEVRKTYLSVGSADLQIWGFNQDLFAKYEEENDIRPLRFLKWTLPLGFGQKIYREKEVFEKQYTEKEARAAAIDQGKKELLGQLGEDAEVKGQKVLHQTNENGKVKLTVLYQVIENIVKTTPIVQGD
ncbi:sporulation protein YqfD [Metabacillus sp. SLBN-84]